MSARPRLCLSFLLALLGCAENRPYHAYVGERSSDEVATIACGLNVRADLRISRAADGKAVYDAATLQNPCGAGLNEVQLDPGEYFISFSACAYKSACDRVFAKVSLLAGHRYGANGDSCFGYMCALEGRSDAPSYQTWAWIEDETAGGVVAGRKY
jgi:hypothetical protein